MKLYKFYKDEMGWFVDLPDSGFTKLELQMVAGADTFCDIIAQGESEFYLTLSSIPFEGCNCLIFTKFGRLEGWELGEGAWYICKNYNGIRYELEMWLCDVTKYVFGDYFPKHIYFK